MAAAGLGATCCSRTRCSTRALSASSKARVTVAVDSEATIEAAAAGGVREVLIDVNVGLPRCGCAPEDAGRLAELARKRGLSVRGVMGYEGHLMMVRGPRGPGEARRPGDGAPGARAPRRRRRRHLVGGHGHLRPEPSRDRDPGRIVRADGHAYLKLGQPFRLSLAILATVISVSPRLRRGGLRAQVALDGSRQPDHRGRQGLVLLRRARDLRARAEARGGRADPRMARARRPDGRGTTSACTSSTATTSSRAGPSICAAGRSRTPTPARRAPCARAPQP